MGLFDKLKSAVGIGQPKLEVVLATDQIKRGESIKGSIIIHGGSKDVALKMITVEHVEIVSRREWSEAQNKMIDRTIRSTVNKLSMPKNQEILVAGTQITEEFELPVSPMAMNSGHPYSHELKVSLDVPGLDPTKSMKLYII